MTNQVEQVSNIKLSIITISFLVVSIGAFYFSGSALYGLLQDTTNKEDIIVFNKTGFYFFGAAIVFLIFPIIVVCKNILKLDISKKVELIFNIILLFSVVLTFAAPYLAHSYMKVFAEDNNYLLCKGKSERALYVTTLIYSKPGKCEARDY